VAAQGGEGSLLRAKATKEEDWEVYVFEAKSFEKDAGEEGFQVQHTVSSSI
jgi:hypothetical protein